MPAKKKTAPKAAKPIPAILIAYSESDFTNPHEAMLAAEPKDCRGDFTHMGAKYWGFESRRHMATTVVPGEPELEYDHNAHGWMLIGLRKRGKIDKITISTKWYTGNQVRAVSVYLTDELTGGAKQVLERQSLKPDSEHVFKIAPTLATQAYVEVYYEGGLSRINFFGDTGVDQPPAQKDLLQGAKITHVSNVHYGVPDRCVGGDRQQMHMYGWESARTGCGEQALFHLKKPAVIEEVVVDTYLHRLNAPLTAHVFAVNAKGQDINKLMKQAPKWCAVFDGKKVVVPDNFSDYMMNQKYLKEKGVKDNEHFRIRLNIPKGCPWKAVVPFEPLSPDTFHRFRDVNDVGPVTHVLYMHYDNGGIHGLKVFGVEE